MDDSRARLDCSVIISTHNRRALLADVLADLTSQQLDHLQVEALIVDNASTDDTAALLNEYAARHPWLIPLHEPARGPACGRNAGIARARGRIIAFTDDDTRLAPDWIAQLVAALDAHPEVEAIAGRIVPNWPGHAPSWLTREHWVGPLALQDYGDTAFIIDASRPLAVSTANLAIRRTVLDRIGAFAPHLQRAEDTELLLRLWRAGGRCLYVPTACVAAVVPPERMTREYHRQWHDANGVWTAAFDWAELIDRDGRLRAPQPETLRIGGVPAFMLRELLTSFGRWVQASATRSSRAPVYEHRMRFVWGYMRSSYERHRRTHGPVHLREIRLFMRALMKKKFGGAPPPLDAAAADGINARTQPPSDPTKSPASSHSAATAATSSDASDRYRAPVAAHPTAQLDCNR